MTASKPVYKRIILKLSGEALAGDSASGIEPAVLEKMAAEILTISQMQVEVGVVIGGGNLFRGAALSQAGLDRVTGDHMGMLATLMNALAMRDVFERNHLECRIMSAIPMSGMVDHYDRRKAIHHLREGRIVIFAAGAGNPLITTDSAASLRAVEVHADAVLKATNVDGVYSDDPRINAQATFYPHLTYAHVLEKELKVMDLAAFCQCRDYDIPLHVFQLDRPKALWRVVMGEEEGTLVNNADKEHG